MGPALFRFEASRIAESGVLRDLQGLDAMIGP